MSQRTPLKPGSHRQVKEPAAGTHEPLFRHGPASHWSTSAHTDTQNLLS